MAWYLTDMLGSVRQLSQTNGTVLDTLTYDSFGNILTETGTGDRFKYTLSYERHSLIAHVVVRTRP